MVFGPHLLGDAIGAKGCDIAPDVDACLVDRVSERLAGIAANDEPARLGHERAHVSDVAANHNVDPLHRNTAPRSGFALDHQQPAVCRGTCGLGCAAFDPDGAAHHVLGDAGARVAVDRDMGLLIHARGVVADVARDAHPYRRVQADRDVVCAVGVGDERSHPRGRVRAARYSPRAAGWLPGRTVADGARTKSSHRFHA